MAPARRPRFATVAASSTLRHTLAQNIDALLDQTGATSIDIDWEHPATTAHQLNNYSLMVQRIKQEVGADRRVYATIDADQYSCRTQRLQRRNAIDGVSLMTYDLVWWCERSDGPNRGEHSLPEYVTDCVRSLDRSGRFGESATVCICKLG